MKRDLLITAVRRAAEGLGYTFFSGPESSVAGRVTSFPAAWLSSLKVVSEEGLRECRATYRVSLHLMATAGEEATGAEDIWRALEADAAAIYRTVAGDDNVRCAGSLKCTPGKAPITKSMDYSVAAEFDAEPPAHTLQTTLHEGLGGAQGRRA